MAEDTVVALPPDPTGGGLKDLGRSPNRRPRGPDQNMCFTPKSRPQVLLPSAGTTMGSPVMP